MLSKINVAHNLKLFIISVKNVEFWQETLNEVFSFHLTKSQSKTVFSDLSEHILTSFKIDPNFLFHYFFFRDEITFDELGLNQAYRNVYNTIRKLKLKYGPIITQLQNQKTDPFMVRFTEINVKQNQSTHNIRIERNDGEYISFNFRPDTLLPVLIIFTQGLLQSLQTGIYNLDRKILDDYIKESNKLIDFIRSLIDE